MTAQQIMWYDLWDNIILLVFHSQLTDHILVSIRFENTELGKNDNRH